MPTVEREAPSKWAKDFARSIRLHSRWRGWTPSPRQEVIMRRLVSEIFDQDHNLILIEEDEPT